MDVKQNPEITKILQTIKQIQGERKSQGERINKLLEAQKTWKGHETRLTRVKEPVLLFNRRNGSCEIIEGMTKGIYEFRHSNGEKRFIIIDPNRQIRLGIGKEQIRCYWGHEDHPTTGWPDPVITTEQVNMHSEKLMNDLRNWQAKSKEATGYAIFLVCAGIALVLMAYFMFKPQTAAQIINIGSNMSLDSVNETAKAAIHAIANANLTKPIV